MFREKPEDKRPVSITHVSTRDVSVKLVSRKSIIECVMKRVLLKQANAFHLILKHK